MHSKVPQCPTNLPLKNRQAALGVVMVCAQARHNGDLSLLPLAGVCVCVTKVHTASYRRDQKNVSHLVLLRSVYRLLPFRSVSVHICILATRPPRRARNGRVSRGTTVAKHRPIIVKKRIKGDIAPTQLLEALPSHKNPRLSRAPAENV